MNTMEEQNKKYKETFNHCMEHIIKCKECGWVYTDEGQQTPFQDHVRPEDGFKWTREIYLPNDSFCQVWDSYDNTPEDLY